MIDIVSSGRRHSLKCVIKIEVARLVSNQLQRHGSNHRTATHPNAAFDHVTGYILIHDEKNRSIEAIHTFNRGHREWLAGLINTHKVRIRGYIWIDLRPAPNNTITKRPN